MRFAGNRAGRSTAPGAASACSRQADHATFHRRPAKKMHIETGGADEDRRSEIGLLGDESKGTISNSAATA